MKLLALFPERLNPPGIANFVPVTSQMLLNPPAEDWLMFSRTYDAQRHSPLNQITRQRTADEAGVLPLPHL